MQNSLLILETGGGGGGGGDSHRFTIFIYFPGFCLTFFLEGHNASRFPSETTTIVTLRTPESAEAWPQNFQTGPSLFDREKAVEKNPWNKPSTFGESMRISIFFLTWPKFFGCPSGNVFIFLVVKHRFLGGSPC